MALRKLISNMRQQNHVCSLILTDRSRAVSSITAGTDIHNLTEPLDGNLILVPFDKLKPYGFCFAKNTVAFFNISLSSRNNRFSLRRRSFSWIRSICGSDGVILLRSSLIQRFSVEKPIPKSHATCLRLIPTALIIDLYPISFGD